MRPYTKYSTIQVPVDLLRRLVPLVIDGNNYRIEMGEPSDSDAEMEFEKLLTDKRVIGPKSKKPKTKRSDQWD